MINCQYPSLPYDNKAQCECLLKQNRGLRTSELYKPKTLKENFGISGYNSDFMTDNTVTSDPLSALHKN